MTNSNNEIKPFNDPAAVAVVEEIVISTEDWGKEQVSDINSYNAESGEASAKADKKIQFAPVYKDDDNDDIETI